MWDNLLKLLSQYPNAVLTGFDAQGYPFSQRCTPQPEAARQVLRIAPFGQVSLQPGPASLLCHSFNQEVWNLKSVQVLGRIEPDGKGWVFHPERLLGGMGSSPMDQFKMLSAGRAEAQKYLKKRGLARPKVIWPDIRALQIEGKKRAQKG